MRLALGLCLLLLAGCVSPAHTTMASKPASHPAPATSLAAPVEIGGANVTWVGTGSTDFDVVVPKGAADLAAIYWTATPAKATAAYHEATIKMDGCSDTSSGGGGTGSYLGGGGAWCKDPPVGKHHVSWTMTTGYLDGRVCIVARPEAPDTFGDCRFSPFPPHA